MNEYKEFHITLPSGEIIRRNSEGLYGSNNIVVDKDYVIDTLVQNHQKQGKEEMKFYEVNEPYYALIKAKNDENAMTIYTDVVADDDGGLSEEITEVTEAYATIIYSRVNGEDNNVIPVKEVLEHLTSEEEMVLIIDGSLL
ncbi:hypothetical protein M5W63_19345 [Bacillus pumilus]|uniref:hypothetical protein n=1 Tax=Bacillus pumilus TaxID=1408 RepID=UPI00227DFB67|nr:hypothetical protein [Bacillus pumilus]MCY9674650.1 hypothetical protein [Bacillus pumilus]